MSIIRVILSILISLNVGSVKAQEKVKVDTIKSYDIFLEGGSNGYFIDGQRVPKGRYDYYKKIFDQIGTCTPCWVKDYNLSEELISEGLYYTDCPIGKMIDYYSTGIIKAQGNYKPNPTNNWANWYQKGGCRKEGEWKYYDENGTLIKIENYRDGKLTN